MHGRATRQALILGLLILAGASSAQAEQQRLLVAPHATDARLLEKEPPHLVVYEKDAVAEKQPLFVWLAGTNGEPAKGPRKLFDTALQQGYRLVGISYLTDIAVGQVCVPKRAASMPQCAGVFRQQRVWGDLETNLIDDKPQDAIVSRLSKLLQHLVQADPDGQWAQYLDGAEPKWDRVFLAGQSQGGGMAAYLAQTRRVAGVLVFSGGWDHGRSGEIAPWYKRPSITPPERWFATYHVDEPQGPTMAQIYRTLGIPADHVHALNQPVMGRMAHGEGISNLTYQPLWTEALKR